MTVNVISDIHASVNKKNGKVVYDVKSQFSKKRIDKSFNILYETFYNKDGLNFEIGKRTEKYTPDPFYFDMKIFSIQRKI